MLSFAVRPFVSVAFNLNQFVDRGHLGEHHQGD